jgi:hypothetical protein
MEVSNSSSKSGNYGSEMKGHNISGNVQECGRSSNNGFSGRDLTEEDREPYVGERITGDIFPKGFIAEFGLEIKSIQLLIDYMQVIVFGAIAILL